MFDFLCRSGNGRTTAAMVATLALVATAIPARADEVTLSAVSAFAEGTNFSENFETFIDRVNETGEGLVQIDYKGGGGKVINPFELGDAVRSGVVQIGNLPAAFYTRIVPEADAIKLSAFTIAEERENGAWAYLNRLHEEKMNAYHLARQKECVPFHLYLNTPIDSQDLTGLKIRVTPIYRAFFADMGADMIRTRPGDVYTAMERGTVDGYGWPAQGVFDLGWHEVTRYRVDPGFYRAAVEFVVNLDTWNGLDEAQRQVLTDAAAEIEALCAAERERSAEELERQVTEAGFEVITFEGADGEAFVERAYRTGWEEFIRANPEHGPTLRELMSR